VGNFRNFAVWVIIAMLMFALFNLFQQPGQQTRSTEKSYSDFISDVQSADPAHPRCVDLLHAPDAGRRFGKAMGFGKSQGQAC
jgi:hypothetical protein